MAPEVRDKRPYGLSADIYSFGLCMYKVIMHEYPKCLEQVKD
jgi:serine/threonine protein kinase